MHSLAATDNSRVFHCYPAGHIVYFGACEMGRIRLDFTGVGIITRKSGTISTMEFNQLIADFAARYNVDGLADEDGTATVSIDGIVITLVAVGDSLIFHADIGEPPIDGQAEFSGLLLEANLESESFFAKNRENGRYVIVRRLALNSLNASTFDTALAALVNAAEVWRRLLMNFHPAAKTAGQPETDISAFGSSGFMQV